MRTRRLRKVCLLRGTRETLARAIHSEYLRNQRATGDTLKKNASLRYWDDLPEELKEANREQADDLRARLDIVGCHFEPMANWNEPLLEFSRDEVEVMAAKEHERWANVKLRAGWHRGSTNVTAQKKHLCLVPYAELPEEEKEKDRNAVRAIPKFLAAIGFRVERVHRKS